jgi:hypothetical protein
VESACADSHVMNFAKTEGKMMVRCCRVSDKAALTRQGIWESQFCLNSAKSYEVAFIKKVKSKLGHEQQHCNKNENA